MEEEEEEEEKEEGEEEEEGEEDEEKWAPLIAASPILCLYSKWNHDAS